MNRERLLFAAVLGILVLWFVLRTPPAPVVDKDSGQLKLARTTVAGAAHPERRLADTPRPVPPWTLVTNVKPHPRPLDELIKPARATLPNIWPPTSRSVSTERLRILRRDAAPVEEGEAQIQLPEPTEGGTEAGTPAEDRVDAWKSYGASYSGRVTAIVAGGKRVTERDRESGAAGITPCRRQPSGQYHDDELHCRTEHAALEHQFDVVGGLGRGVADAG